MDATAFETSKARALALCRQVAAEPIPAEEMLADLLKAAERQAVQPTMSEDELDELQVLTLVVQAVGTLQVVGAAIPQSAAPVVIYRTPTAGVPSPVNR